VNGGTAPTGINTPSTPCNCIGNFKAAENGQCTLCKDGYAGPNCTLTCTGNYASDPYTGLCTWCKDGYSGPNCTSDYCNVNGGSIPAGLGNHSPTTPCNCAVHHVVDAITGLCTNCEVGWKKDSNGKCTLCDSANGYAGPNCTAGYCNINCTPFMSWFCPQTSFPVLTDNPNDVNVCGCPTTAILSSNWTTSYWAIARNPVTGKCDSCPSGYNNYITSGQYPACY
jgi:hypothetical protein